MNNIWFNLATYFFGAAITLYIMLKFEVEPYFDFSPQWTHEDVIFLMLASIASAVIHLCCNGVGNRNPQ